jgi:hypothetical protein
VARRRRPLPRCFADEIATAAEMLSEGTGTGNEKAVALSGAANRRLA